jgi:uncharacterized Ntn-hydrolase superfamily protein
MTFSLVARCQTTGMFGIVISSSSPAVAARCSHVRARTGVVASQNVTDPALGPMALDLMQEGLSAGAAIKSLVEEQPFIEYRQLLVVDRDGNAAIHSGPESLGIWTDARAENVAAGGNLLANEGVPQAMVDAYLASSGHLGDRLMIALRAGFDAGGEAGPVHSAGLKMADRLSWPVVDLRCDWTEACPIEAVEKAWEVYKPQLEAYVQRALDPRAAPSYGVPGDE